MRRQCRCGKDPCEVGCQARRWAKVVGSTMMMNMIRSFESLMSELLIAAMEPRRYPANHGLLFCSEVQLAQDPPPKARGVAGSCWCLSSRRVATSTEIPSATYSLTYLPTACKAKHFEGRDRPVLPDLHKSSTLTSSSSSFPLTNLLLLSLPSPTPSITKQWLASSNPRSRFS